MHVLVLKSITVYSSYSLSEFTSKKAHFEKNRKASKRPLVLFRIDPSQIFDLNTPSDRPCQELLNACFSFEIGQSKYKWQAFKDSCFHCVRYVHVHCVIIFLIIQVYCGLEYHAEPADLWSCAIVLVALLAGGEVTWHHQHLISIFNY